MKRMHLHESVPDLAQSIDFYATLFGAPPTVVKSDYAKWMLDDPRVNFAISQRGLRPGVDHLGIQAETPEELGALATRLKDAGQQTFDQDGITCCYARSDKTWVTDPAGVHWETFHTFGEATEYGEDHLPIEDMAQSTTSCCGAPSKADAAACC
jgi:catechol 2,3-dioxygenase-like lactoylglutathione lyase family enzyme